MHDLNKELIIRCSRAENIVFSDTGLIRMVATDDKDMIAKFEKRFKNVYEN